MKFVPYFPVFPIFISAKIFRLKITDQKGNLKKNFDGISKLFQSTGK